MITLPAGEITYHRPPLRLIACPGVRAGARIGDIRIQRPAGIGGHVATAGVGIAAQQRGLHRTRGCRLGPGRELHRRPDRRAAADAGDLLVLGANTTAGRAKPEKNALRTAYSLHFDHRGARGGDGRPGATGGRDPAWPPKAVSSHVRPVTQLVSSVAPNETANRWQRRHAVRGRHRVRHGRISKRGADRPSLERLLGCTPRSRRRSADGPEGSLNGCRDGPARRL